MVEDLKKALAPTINLIKELNVQVKEDEVDPDLILKIATTMKVCGIKLEKIIKDNKLELKAGLNNNITEEDEE